MHWTYSISLTLDGLMQLNFCVLLNLLALSWYPFVKVTKANQAQICKNCYLYFSQSSTSGCSPILSQSGPCFPGKYVMIFCNRRHECPKIEYFESSGWQIERFEITRRVFTFLYEMAGWSNLQSWNRVKMKQNSFVHVVNFGAGWEDQ